MHQSIRVAARFASARMLSLLLLVGASGAAEAQALNPCGGVTVSLSPVGAAMSALPRAGIQHSTCAGVPEFWLYNLDGLDSTVTQLEGTIQAQLEATTSSFSHASLYFHPNLGFAPGLAALHTNVGLRVGAFPVPQALKPIVRLYFGGPNETAQQIYDSVTAPLVALAGADPAQWNVRVAVGRSETQLNGWNHSKLSVRDRIEAIATSYETAQQELAIHLAGEPASHAANWFDTIWNQRFIPCVGDSSLCYTVPTAPSVTATTPHAFRSANVLALSRGSLDSGQNFDADDALVAGMGATERSMFFLNPALVGFVPPYSNIFSPIFMENVGDAIARGVDVKFVWGTDAQARSPGVWNVMEDILEARFADHQLNPVRRAVGHCMFHMVSYRDARPGAVSPESHAKFYMLDDGFYVGSQNLYPSGFMGRVYSPELKEFGFFVDTRPGVNEDLADEVISRIVEPVWNNSRAAVEPSAYATCNALAHPVRASGSANTPFGVFTCGSDFNLTLDFQNVAHDQVAIAQGQTTCTSSIYTVYVGVQGVIGTDGVFTGTISGHLPGLTGDTAPLTGVFHQGALNASFSGLEPIQGVPYSGTVSTRMPPP
ncbi:hypothetical protein [Pyxidicoccus caerfyrddinensis]|uniref:hypothetical protein n=1 Tax=Pyxidicoccus caerfyrddinensis TaxID=2709663 RepID=UPI0013DB0806|nr:hypothetical protein [Pyxidicoccus caerfyrddinensis]